MGVRHGLALLVVGVPSLDGCGHRDKADAQFLSEASYAFRDERAAEFDQAALIAAGRGICKVTETGGPAWMDQAGSQVAQALGEQRDRHGTLLALFAAHSYCPDAVPSSVKGQTPQPTAAR